MRNTTEITFQPYTTEHRTPNTKHPTNLMNDYELVKEQIRSQISVIDAFTKYGIEVRSGKCCCLWHEEKTPSCQVHEEYYHCFGCGTSGDLFTFVQDREGCDFMEALRLLAQECNIQLQAETPQAREQRQRSDDAVAALTASNRLYMAAMDKELADGGPVADYVIERGLDSPEVREAWGIGWAPNQQASAFLSSLELLTPADEPQPSINGLRAAGLLGKKDGYEYTRFRQRLTFALHDARGRIVGFSARLVPGVDIKSSAKYVNSPESDVYTKGRTLYGLWQARSAIRKSGEAMLVEGQIDAIACHCNGFTDAIAPLGTALTKDQAVIIARYARQVTICYDGDDPGQSATEKAIDLLLPLVDRVDVAGLPIDKDVADLLGEV